eukprot:scaffold317343_cov31-Prasinocladus_malaysianus.AAC.5
MQPAGQSKCRTLSLLRQQHLVKSLARNAKSKYYKLVKERTAHTSKLHHAAPHHITPHCINILQNTMYHRACTEQDAGGNI